MGKCLVTGASRGIGCAIAVKLASSGFEVLAHGRDTKALAETLQAITASGKKAQSVIADLSNEVGIETIIESVAKGPLDLLVNNAGVAFVKPFEKITAAEWNQTLAVNVTAPFMLTKRLVPVMLEGASIVNILSIAARTGFPNWSSYSMSKFALEGLMQSIREELRTRRIRVINIYPSATRTGMWQRIEGDWPTERMVSPKEVAEAVYYAVSRPAGVLVENLSVGDITGEI